MTLVGLRNVLRKYERTKEDAVVGTHWSIVTGGYDCWWELYYDHLPVACCILGGPRNECLDEAEFDRLFKVVKEEYPDMRK